jgi:hypothetical protein
MVLVWRGMGLPSPILRCLSSTSHSRATPRSALRWAAPVGPPGALGAPHEPWARRGRRQGALARGRRQKRLCISHPRIPCPRLAAGPDTVAI